MTNLYKGITGSTLKWIAIGTMFIDHLAAAILVRIIIFYGNSEELYTVYRVMRTIGRVAFPIFCFLLVEGFMRTRNIGKYIGRMALFVILAEIPYDLVFLARTPAWEDQSVMLTLLIGLLAMWGCSLIEKKWPENHIVQWVGFVICLGLGMWLAYLLKTDYAHKGILSIMAMYFFRKDRNMQILAGGITFCWEPWALLAFPLIYLYNGQRGMKMKYFFYAFYPLHLLLFYAIAFILGIHFIPVI
ncbi:MAG: conjugal transfer protein TraX [Lachnospiraceae bacterium]|nr:conjugal transfer protein TraX [Lachnospiraceae bacterium]